MGMLNASQKRDEPRGLHRGIDVERACQHRGLVGDHPKRVTVEAGQADDDVLREVRVHLVELAVVDDEFYQIDDVVWLVGGVGDDRGQALVHPVGPVEGGEVRRNLHVVRRQVRDQIAHLFERLTIARCREVGDARHRGVGVRASQILERHRLAGHGFDHVGPGDEEMGRVLYLVHEVGDGGRVHRASGARPHDHRDLGDHSGGSHIALEDAAVAVERHHPFLDAGAPGVLEGDQRCPRVERQVHDLGDLVGNDITEAPSEVSEILGEDEDRLGVDRSPARDDGVTEGAAVLDAEPAGLVAHEGTGLLERALVEQERDPLPGRELSQVVLTLDGPLVVGLAQFFAKAAQTLDLAVGTHCPPYILSAPG